MRFINFERTKLPEEILRHNLEEKRKYFLDICLDAERNDAEIQVSAVLILCLCMALASVSVPMVMSAYVCLKLFILAVTCKFSWYTFFLNELG